MVTDKILKLARKLNALAERGVGGEKESAQTQLERIMKKHGLSYDDINGTEIISQVFTVGKYRRLFIQVVVSVSSDIKIFGHKGTKTKIILDCTAEEMIEVQSKFEFYKKAYQREFKDYESTFFEAFVQKNQLYSNAEPEEKELTPEDLKRLKKVLSLAEELEENHYYKHLEK